LPSPGSQDFDDLWSDSYGQCALGVSAESSGKMHTPYIAFSSGRAADSSLGLFYSLIGLCANVGHDSLDSILDGTNDGVFPAGDTTPVTTQPYSLPSCLKRWKKESCGVGLPRFGVGSGLGLELFHRREAGLRKRESSCRHVAVLFAEFDWQGCSGSMLMIFCRQLVATAVSQSSAVDDRDCLIHAAGGTLHSVYAPNPSPQQALRRRCYGRRVPVPFRACLPNLHKSARLHDQGQLRKQSRPWDGSSTGDTLGLRIHQRDSYSTTTLSCYHHQNNEADRPPRLSTLTHKLTIQSLLLTAAMTCPISRTKSMAVDHGRPAVELYTNTCMYKSETRIKIGGKAQIKVVAIRFSTNQGAHSGTSLTPSLREALTWYFGSLVTISGFMLLSVTLSIGAGNTFESCSVGLTRGFKGCCLLSKTRLYAHAWVTVQYPLSGLRQSPRWCMLRSMPVSDSDVWFESSLYRQGSMLVEHMLLGIAASSAAARAPSPKHVVVLTTAAIRSLFSNINFPMTGASQGSIPFCLG
ncbi:hypothetical protein KCU87_g76, partial [Aureobasidium melanogenum]